MFLNSRNVCIRKALLYKRREIIFIREHRELGVDHLSSEGEGGLSDFEKNISCKHSCTEKIFVHTTTAENFSCKALPDGLTNIMHTHAPRKKFIVHERV